MCPAYYYPSPFDFNQNLPIVFGSSDCGIEESIVNKQDHFFEHWNNNLNPIPIVYENIQHQNHQPEFNFFLDETDFSSIHQPIATNANPQFINQSSSSSLGLLNDYGPGLKKLKGERRIRYEAESDQRSRLSTEEIMRAAGAKFIQSSIRRDEDRSAVGAATAHLSSSLAASSTSLARGDDARDVELAVLLLAAAEKVGYKQFDRGSKLLTHCEWIASQKANTVQKIVSVFAGALRARIGKETGKFCYRSAAEKNNELAEGLGTNLSTVAYHLHAPFTQVMQFAAVQCVLENIGPSITKIHLVDLEIRSGVHWTVLMEALKDRPIERLTVTAVGRPTNKKTLEKTGKSLTNFAGSKNLPFLFKIVIVKEIEELRREMFEIRDDETVVIYAMMILRTLLYKPESLESLMEVMRNLSPLLMVVIEVEANHNSPLFVGRFIEALFFFSAYFDCLAACMEEGDEHRAVIESLLREGVVRIVAEEGRERTTRSVKVEVWREFFRRFGMGEARFSESAQYQAKLVAKRFGRGGACTLEKNGRSLVVGWKGTPINSVSVWRFN